MEHLEKATSEPTLASFPSPMMVLNPGMPGKSLSERESRWKRAQGDGEGSPGLRDNEPPDGVPFAWGVHNPKEVGGRLPNWWKNNGRRNYLGQKWHPEQNELSYPTDPPQEPP